MAALRRRAGRPASPAARDLFETARGPRRPRSHDRAAARPPLPRSPRIFDALELYAFARPARFTAPSAAGLAQALGLPEPRGPEEQAATLRLAVAGLLAELAASPVLGEEAPAIAAEPGARRLALGAAVIGALRSEVPGTFRSVRPRLRARLSEGGRPRPRPGSRGPSPWTPANRPPAGWGLEARPAPASNEARPTQADYAAETAFVFQPREREGEPRMMLAEAGTGVGKTLGYLLPLARPARPRVQRPRRVDLHLHRAPPAPDRARGAAPSTPTRRCEEGRRPHSSSNFPRLLNFQDLVNAQLGQGDSWVGIGLAARWARATRDAT